MDALDLGFSNVEADVWLRDGQILVAHDEEDLRPDRTLLNTYLQPLAELARGNDGCIFEPGAEFVLLIDIKNEPEAIYAALKREIEPIREMLSEYQAGKGVIKRGVTLMLSGDKPTATVSGEDHRFVFIDGRLPDLDQHVDKELMPWISDNWEEHFDWRGEGPLQPPDARRLAGIVDRAHSLGCLVRFWSAPDSPTGWQTLLDFGADLLSTDRLCQLSTFLRDGKLVSSNESD